MPLNHPSPHRILWLGLALLSLLLSSTAWGEASLLHRYQVLRNGEGTTLPGTTISVASSEKGEVLSAEVISILHHPFPMVAASLEKAENWCQFIPLHFNIKACTYETREGREVLTFYSGRKTYQSPQDSYEMTYHFEASREDDTRLSLQLRAEHGPVNTRDYRLELNVQQVEEGTLLHIQSSYRPSTISSMLTRGYLSTLGRDKVGFTRIKQDGQWRLVQGVRGVIERNVMRYHLAVDSFLNTRSLPEASRHKVALRTWFRQNDSYPEQLHEMEEAEYMEIKRKEWYNQQQLQQALNDRIKLAATPQEKTDKGL